MNPSLKSLAPYRDVGILIMRVGIGAMFLGHGVPKLLGGPEKWEGIGGAMAAFGIDFAPTFWGFMAGAAEAGGGALLIAGLFTRPAAAFLIFTMFVAASRKLMIDDLPLMKAAHPIEMMFAFLGILFIGAGAYSLDRMLFGEPELGAAPVDDA